MVEEDKTLVAIAQQLGEVALHLRRGRHVTIGNDTICFALELAARECIVEKQHIIGRGQLRIVEIRGCRMLHMRPGDVVEGIEGRE